MKITYFVQDGYVCGDRPLEVEIPGCEIEDCETQEELVELVYDYVQNDFEQRVTWDVGVSLAMVVSEWESMKSQASER